MIRELTPLTCTYVHCFGGISILRFFRFGRFLDQLGCKHLDLILRQPCLNVRRGDPVRLIHNDFLTGWTTRSFYNRKFALS